MKKTIQSIFRTARGPLLAVAALAGLQGVQAGQGGAGQGAILARGLTFHPDFNGDGRIDNRSFHFLARERQDGSVTGFASLTLLIDDLDQDGTPDIEPIQAFFRLQLDDGARFSRPGLGDLVVCSGIVTATNFPVGCPPGVSVGNHMVFAVEDNGPGADDRISPIAGWSCVPFDPGDVIPNYPGGLADFVVDFGPAIGGDGFFPPAPAPDGTIGGLAYVDFLVGQLTDVVWGNVTVN